MNIRLWRRSRAYIEKALKDRAAQSTAITTPAQKQIVNDVTSACMELRALADPSRTTMKLNPIDPAELANRLEAITSGLRATIDPLTREDEYALIPLAEAIGIALGIVAHEREELDRDRLERHVLAALTGSATTSSRPEDHERAAINAVSIARIAIARTDYVASTIGTDDPRSGP